MCGNHRLCGIRVWTDADIDRLALTEPAEGWGEWIPPNEIAVAQAKDLLSRLDWTHPHEIDRDAQGGFAFYWGDGLDAYVFNSGRIAILGMPRAITSAAEAAEHIARLLAERGDKGVP